MLPAAFGDYRQGLRFYSKRSARAASGFETAVEVALQRIGESPERWALCDERHRFYVLRKFPYSIVYRILDENEVLVIAVAHSSRDENYWRGRT